MLSGPTSETKIPIHKNINKHCLTTAEPFLQQLWFYFEKIPRNAPTSYYIPKQKWTIFWAQKDSKRKILLKLIIKRDTKINVWIPVYKWVTKQIKNLSGPAWWFRTVIIPIYSGARVTAEYSCGDTWLNSWDGVLWNLYPVWHQTTILQSKYPK
jgi:hypothetical protein